ncbi:MAG: hypothetical protein KW793_02090 [Candidatus Doudnabacteria bacterium]|nr:hypothetical protein [Candidatus Doudnabacteria bacterium]
MYYVVFTEGSSLRAHLLNKEDDYLSPPFDGDLKQAKELARQRYKDRFVEVIEHCCRDLCHLLDAAMSVVAKFQQQSGSRVSQ